MRDQVEKFLTEKPERFRKRGIFKLREKWGNLVQQNGTYVTQ